MSNMTDQIDKNAINAVHAVRDHPPCTAKISLHERYQAPTRTRYVRQSDEAGCVASPTPQLALIPASRPMSHCAAERTALQHTCNTRGAQFRSIVHTAQVKRDVESLDAVSPYAVLSYHSLMHAADTMTRPTGAGSRTSCISCFVAPQSKPPLLVRRSEQQTKSGTADTG